MVEGSGFESNSAQPTRDTTRDNDGQHGDMSEIARACDVSAAITDEADGCKRLQADQDDPVAAGAADWCGSVTRAVELLDAGNVAVACAVLAELLLDAT